MNSNRLGYRKTSLRLVLATCSSLLVLSSWSTTSTAANKTELSPSGFELSREALAAKYPQIEEGSLQPENKKILCPFHRMLERAGIYDADKKEQSALTVSIIKIASFAREFGCMVAACGAVSTAASAGQLTQGTTNPGSVNVESLHTAIGIAHDCGLTFAKGGTEVSDSVRASTLAALAQRADSEGRLSLSDLETVKLNICAAQGVENTSAGAIEVGLIYTFLGGNKRGFIDYADVERLFFAELPKTIGRPSVPSK
jgi:hypothetical protein